MKGIWFFDDWMLERRDCLERVWGKPTFVKELFTEFAPPGYSYGGYITAFFDERLGRYVMYIVTYPPYKKGFTDVLRLQSDDPYDWPNPSYDPSVSPDWNGFKDVTVDQNGDPIWAYSVHSLASTPLADRGYVTTMADIPRHLTLGGFSDDGVHFTIDRDRPWLNPGADDCGDILWNPEAGVYEIITRPLYADRRIAISVTKDFKEFSRPITVLQPGAQDRTGTEFYDLRARPYEGMYIGMNHVFTTDHFEETSSVSPPWPWLKYYGRMETELTYSYNGLHWYRSDREPFMGLRDYGLPGGGTVYGMEMLRTSDDALLFYASGSKAGHGDDVAVQEAGLDSTGLHNTLLYKMRLDGFCSLKTPGYRGVLRTKTIVPKSGQISLNVRTMAHTEIRVQILDGKTAEPIPGYSWDEAQPISGDHLFAEPRWKKRNDISELIDRPIRIEIAMREAELFGIRNECEALYACEPLTTLW